jgi:hypothetical protein
MYSLDSHPERSLKISQVDKEQIQLSNHSKKPRINPRSRDITTQMRISCSNLSPGDNHRLIKTRPRRNSLLNNELVNMSFLFPGNPQDAGYDSEEGELLKETEEPLVRNYNCTRTSIAL